MFWIIGIFLTFASHSVAGNINNLQIGNAFYSQKNYLQAERHYKLAVSTEPRNAQAYYGLGASEFMLNEFSEAEENFRQALDIQPDFSAAQVFLEKCLEKGSEKNKGKLFSEAMEAGAIAFHDGAYLKARSWFRQAVVLDSKSSDARYYLGSTLLKLNSLNEAINQFEICLRLEPENSGAKAKLIEIMANRGELAKVLGSDSQALAKIAGMNPFIDSRKPDDVKPDTTNSSFRPTFQTSTNFTGSGSGGQPSQFQGWVQNIYGGILYNTSFSDHPFNMGYLLGGAYSPSNANAGNLSHRFTTGLSPYRTPNLASFIVYDEGLIQDSEGILAQTHQIALSLIEPTSKGSIQTQISMQNSFYPASPDYNANNFSGSLGFENALGGGQVLNMALNFGHNQAENNLFTYNSQGLSAGYRVGGGPSPSLSINYSFQGQNYPNALVSNGDTRQDFLHSLGIEVSLPLVEKLRVAVGYQLMHVVTNATYYSQRTSNFYGSLDLPF
jgi:hypothetical protein